MSREGVGEMLAKALFESYKGLCELKKYEAQASKEYKISDIYEVGAPYCDGEITIIVELKNIPADQVIDAVETVSRLSHQLTSQIIPQGIITLVE